MKARAFAAGCCTNSTNLPQAGRCYRRQAPSLAGLLYAVVT